MRALTLPLAAKVSPAAAFAWRSLTTSPPFGLKVLIVALPPTKPLGPNRLV